MWKYILIGIVAMILEGVFVVMFSGIFNGLSQVEGLVIGTGIFLAFEMVICTGIILTKINKQ
ncbi:MAG: hypothetical protein IKJ59_07180 [Clostridia bacterium]|nr:hypothetical protein [Clostridia bacterium]